MENFSSSKRPPEIDSFAPKAEAAWSALHSRFASRISAAELDRLYAHFIFALTSPAYTEIEPSVHLEMCRALIGLTLPPERVRAALHTIPEPTEPWLESAYETIGRQGTTIGLALVKETRIGEDRSDAESDAGASTDKEIEEKLP